MHIENKMADLYQTIKMERMFHVSAIWGFMNVVTTCRAYKFIPWAHHRNSLKGSCPTTAVHLHTPVYDALVHQIDHSDNRYRRLTFPLHNSIESSSTQLKHTMQCNSFKFELHLLFNFILSIIQIKSKKKN